jgi:hypothetical protein
MLRACMIDGFGWFPEAVYRRNWLLFDEVDYAFPMFAKGISVPPKLFLSREFQVVQPELPGDAIDRIVQTAIADAGDAEFRRYVETAVPVKDAQYAGGIVHADSQVEDRRLLDRARDPAFAISYLAQKLVAYANATGTVPIVGQDYAVNVIARIVRRPPEGPVAADAIVFGRRAAVVHAVAAGLSLRFISNEVLESVDQERLAEFKENGKELREAHHAHLLKVARDYDGLPNDPSFPELLADLRADAEVARGKLDTDARDLWLSLGLDLGGKALVGAASAAVAAIALIRPDLQGVIAAAIPGALTGLALATTKVMETAHKAAAQHRSYVSYLTDARRYLASA